MSSSWTRATLAVGVSAVVLVVAGVFTLQRRGGDDDAEERRAAVSAFIVETNTTQQALIVDLERVSDVYRRLQLKPNAVPDQLEQVEGAEQTLRELRSRLAGVPVPPEARKLRSQILRLVDLHRSLAEEVVGMVRYLPAQTREARRVAAATTRLRDDLRDSTSVEEQRQGFIAYERTVRASRRNLTAAPAPEVFEPSRAGEIARLTRLLSLSEQVRRALEEKDAKEIDGLLARFVQISASVGTTHAEREAVIAFNRRLATITDQRAAVTAERARLDLQLR